jgi:hypothetical protein
MVDISLSTQKEIISHLLNFDKSFSNLTSKRKADFRMTERIVFTECYDQNKINI